MAGAPFVTFTLATWPSGTIAGAWPISAIVGTRTCAAMACGSRPQLARVAHDHAEALAALDGGGHHLAAQGRHDHVLELADGEPVAGECGAIGLDVEVVAAREALGVGAGRARNLLHHALDVARDALHLGQVLAEDLDADRRADAGGEHVDARPDGHRPGVGHAGELHRLVHLGDELVDRHAGAPFALGLQVDHRLEHLERRGVGGRLRAAGLARHARHLGKALEDPVLDLQQLAPPW